MAEGGDMAQKIGLLTEENLARWPKMSTGEQLQLYRTKVEVEIDAQKRLLQQFGKGDPNYVKSVQQNLENLEGKLGQTDAALKNPEVKPDWLDVSQKPQLFSKDWKGYQEAEKLGYRKAENGYRWVFKDGKLTYEAREGGLESKRYNPVTEQFENADPNVLGTKYKSEPGFEQWPNGSQSQASNLEGERASAALQRDKLEAILDRSPEALTPAQQKDLTRLRAEVNEKSRQLGELAGESHIRAKYGDNAVLKWPPVGKGSTSGDFDQVWQVKDANGVEKYVVVEAKGGSSSLGTRKIASGQPAEQGSPEYFEEIIGVMAKAKNPQSKQVARELREASKDGKVEYWEVRARINRQGQATDIKSREFDLSPRQ
jgi:hypothetical protein